MKFNEELVMEKEKKWESLFGSTHDNNFYQSNQSKISNQIVQGAANQKNALREAVGKNLLEKIEESKKILISGAPKKMKASLQQAINKMIRLAQKDVTNLGYLQERAIIAFYHIYEDEDIMKMNEIIARINDLIIQQMERLRKINCSMNIKPIERIKEKSIENNYEMLLKLIKKADYKHSVIPFIAFYCVYSENQAKTLWEKAKQAAKHHPENADYFLEIINLRLFSPESAQPYKIDYTVLKQNEFINNPDIMSYKTSELMVLCMLKNFAINIGGYLWEARLKEQFVEVIKEIDVLTRIIAQKYPKNYYPMFTRYYQENPDS